MPASIASKNEPSKVNGATDVKDDQIEEFITLLTTCANAKGFHMLRHLQHENEALQKEFEDAKTTIRGNARETAEADARANSHVESLAAARRQMDEAALRETQLGEDLAESRRLLQVNGEEVTKLMSQIKQGEASIHELRELVKTREKDIKNAQKDLKKAREELEAEKKESKERSSELIELNNKLLTIGKFKVELRPLRFSQET